MNPPSNIDAERATLGAILLRGSLSDVEAFVTPEDFFFPGHVAVAESAWSIGRAGSPVDVVTLANDMRARGTLAKLDGAEMGLMALSGAVPTTDNGPHYARIVKAKAVLRQIQAACLDTAGQVNESDDPAALVSQLRGLVDTMDLGGDAGTVRIGDVQEAAEDALEGRFMDPGQYVVSTGLRSLDSILGGLKRQEQIVIASNPGQGKTSLAWSILIRAALHGVPCLLFSLEMSLQQMIERAWTLIGEVPGLGFQRPGREQWDKIRQAKAALSKAPLYVNEKRLTFARLEAAARAWRAKQPRGKDGKQPLAIIGIDYAGLVNAKEKGRNREQEVATVSTGCKGIAKELDLTTIMVAQLNRANMKDNVGIPRRPVMSDLRDSGAVEQDADVIIFPWANEGVTRLIVEKHRNGKTGAIRVDFKKELMGFFDLPQERDWHEQEMDS